MSAVQGSFAQGLGSKIDALAVAAADLARNDPHAVETIRHVTKSLIPPAETLGLREICKTTGSVMNSSANDLDRHVQRLIQLLRGVVYETGPAALTVLLIGGHADFNADLMQALASHGTTPVSATTAEQADVILASQPVSCIILSLVLPDMDGRGMFTLLREESRTASIPILILGEHVSDSVKEDSLLHSADGYMEGSPDVTQVANWVGTRLRRNREATKEARRDIVTGLLNRSAFRESFERALAECAISGEPLALAPISVDANRGRLSECTPALREEILQRLGLVLSRSMRATDILARWGTYEFAMLFPGEDQFGGTRAVEKVIEASRKQVFDADDGSSFKLDLAAGVALAPPGSAVDDIMSEADRYVYLAAASGRSRVVSDQSTRPAQRVQRVLTLVHDNVMANVIRQLFEKEGFEVTHITSSDTDINTIVDSQRYHLIAIDEDLPSRGGFAILKELRNQPKNNRTPIVMLIEGGSEEEVARSLDLGANDYMVKPFSPFTFIERMRRLLARGTSLRASSDARCQLLIVDSDVKMLILAASVLHQRGGFEVYLAKGADDACSRFEDLCPDAVIVALDMPGKQAARVLDRTSDPSLRKINVIVATQDTDASGPYEDAVTVPEHVKGTITKPYNPAELAKQVESILGLSHAPEQVKGQTDHLNSEIQRIVKPRD